jgi:hypothetical protein
VGTPNLNYKVTISKQGCFFGQICEVGAGDVSQEDLAKFGDK